MKNRSVKLILWCLFLMAVKIFPRKDIVIEPRFYVFAIAFVVSAFLIYFLPKSWLGLLGGALVTVGVSIYDNEYFLFSAPVLFLLCAHKEVVLSIDVKKKTQPMPPLSIIYSILAMVFLVPQYIYAEDVQRPTELNDGLVDFGLIIGSLLLFVFLFVVTFKYNTSGKNSVKKGIVTALRLIYISAFICLGVTVYTVYMKATVKTIVDDVEFCYWFVFIIMLVLNSDPMLTDLTERFGKMFTKNVKVK